MKSRNWCLQIQSLSLFISLVVNPFPQTYFPQPRRQMSGAISVPPNNAQALHPSPQALYVPT